MKDAERQKLIDRAVEAIKRVCREKDPDDGPPVIGDLATWEIEALIIEAVTEALAA